MATPIFTSIIERINALIGAMTESGGYSFDYGSVNEYDPESRTYPATFTDYEAETAIPDADSVIERTSKYCEVVFRVIIGTSSDVDEDLNKVLGDFDEMFYNNFDGDLNDKGLIDYQYIGNTRAYRLTTARPAEISIVYRLKYRWLKSNPYSN